MDTERANEPKTPLLIKDSCPLKRQGDKWGCGHLNKTHKHKPTTQTNNTTQQRLENMNKKLVTVGATLCGAVALAGCGNTTDTTSSSSGSEVTAAAAAKVDTAPSLNDIFNSRYASTQKICDAYDSLVNQGWTDEDIFNQLNDAGAWDGYQVGAKDVWHALIRWCYAN